jgi:hypothetical protein
MSTLSEKTVRTIKVKVLQGSKLEEEVIIPDELHVVGDDGMKPVEHNRMFRVLSQDKGDDRITWDSRSLADIRAAKDMFVDFIKKGLKPFKVGVDGQATAEVMREFDPLAEEVIFLPMARVVGG